MTIRVADGAITTLDGAEILTGPDPIWARPFQAVAIADDLATVTLPALSVAAMTVRLQN